MFVIGNKLGIQFCAISEPDVDILANALLEEVQGLLIVIHDINLNIIASYDSNFIEITFSEYLYNKVKIPMAAYFAIKSYCIYTTTLFFREIEVINQENLPDDGPVIVYGNHNNQYFEEPL